MSSEKIVQASSSKPKKTKKKDKEQMLATIETPEFSTETISRKEFKEKEKGKIPLEHVMRNIETVPETPDGRRVKEKRRKLELIYEAVKLVKPRKPLTRLAAKERTPVEEEITKEDIHHGVEEVAKVKINPSKKVRFNPKVVMQDTLHRSRTRSAVRSLAYSEEARVEPPVGHRVASLVEVHSSPEESDLRGKRLGNQLREAQDLIIQLREENKEMKVKIATHLDLHKQLKNVYKQKMVLEKENKVLKRKLHRLEEEVAQRNLDMLAQVAG